MEPDDKEHKADVTGQQMIPTPPCHLILPPIFFRGLCLLRSRFVFLFWTFNFEHCSLSPHVLKLQAPANYQILISIFLLGVLLMEKRILVLGLYMQIELKSFVLVFMNLTNIAHNQTDLLFYPTFLRFISIKCVLVKKATQYLFQIL